MNFLLLILNLFLLFFVISISNGYDFDRSNFVNIKNYFYDNVEVVKRDISKFYDILDRIKRAKKQKTQTSISPTNQDSVYVENNGDNGGNSNYGDYQYSSPNSYGAGPFYGSGSNTNIGGYDYNNGGINAQTYDDGNGGGTFQTGTKTSKQKQNKSKGKKKKKGTNKNNNDSSGGLDTNVSDDPNLDKEGSSVNNPPEGGKKKNKQKPKNKSPKKKPNKGNNKSDQGSDNKTGDTTPGSDDYETFPDDGNIDDNKKGKSKKKSQQKNQKKKKKEKEKKTTPAQSSDIYTDGNQGPYDYPIETNSTYEVPQYGDYDGTNTGSGGQRGNNDLGGNNVGRGGDYYPNQYPQGNPDTKNTMQDGGSNGGSFNQGGNGGNNYGGGQNNGYGQNNGNGQNNNIQYLDYYPSNGGNYNGVNYGNPGGQNYPNVQGADMNNNITNYQGNGQGTNNEFNPNTGNGNLQNGNGGNPNQQSGVVKFFSNPIVGSVVGIGAGVGGMYALSRWSNRRNNRMMMKQMAIAQGQNPYEMRARQKMMRRQWKDEAREFRRQNNPGLFRRMFGRRQPNGQENPYGQYQGPQGPYRGDSFRGPPPPGRRRFFGRLG